jgi:4-hydroxy-tetrahydrodipicolinate synthase
MRPDGAIDERALADLVTWHIDAGTAAIVPVGTTGESPTLTHDEHRRVVAVAIEAAAGRAPIIAGAGSNSTAEAVSLATSARQAGAAACLVVVPYYNKPTQEGLYLHFKEVAAVGLPVIIYNIPSRSVVDMSVATMARLAALPNIIGVKDSTQNLVRPLLTRRACGAGFVQLSGEDATAVSFLAAGGDGCISVTANVVPALLAELHSAWQAGLADRAITIQDSLVPLHEALFCETNPAPVKYAMHLLGRAEPICRLPIAPLSPAGRAEVEQAMTELGLLDH